jgi:DNA-binding HxlR family transcriptional regulator
VGERWSPLILRDAMFAGITRFSQFQKSLGVATNILAKRLDDFVAAGIMEHRPGAPGEQAEYVLTRKGMELKPFVVALTDWGDKWVRLGPVRSVDRTSVDRTDGSPVELQFRRTTDDKPVDVADVIAVPR